MQERNVFPKFAPLAKPDAVAKLAAGFSRSRRTDVEIAAAGGCTTSRTIANARDGRGLVEMHTAFNALGADPTVLDEFLAHYGVALCVVEPGAVPDGEALAGLAELLAAYAEAVRDGRRCHQDTLTIAEKIAPLLPWMHAIVAEARRVRG